MDSTVDGVSMVAAQEALGLLLQKLASADGPAYLEELAQFVTCQPCWTGAESYLKLLETSTIAPTQGSVTISNSQGTFWDQNISEFFKEDGVDKPGPDTTEVQVQTYAVRRKCRVLDILGHFDRATVWLQQSQIVEYCKDAKLSHYPLLFPCQTGETRFIVEACFGTGRDVGVMVFAPARMLREDHFLQLSGGQNYFVVLPQPA